jgi:hypothetical protein
MVASNHAVPWHLLGRVDEALDEYRVCMLNAPTGIPDRDGVTPGLRDELWEEAEGLGRLPAP